MYRPWKPLDLCLSCHPALEWRVEGRTIVIIAEFWMTGAKGLVLEIEFDEGLAGFHAFDESTYQSTEGLPGPDELDGSDSEPMPWPFWRFKSNDRIGLYGDLGKISYDQIDTYYLVGADTVLWFDVSDCEPTVRIKQEAEQGGAGQPPTRPRHGVILLSSTPDPESEARPQ